MWHVTFIWFLNVTWFTHLNENWRFYSKKGGGGIGGFKFQNEGILFQKIIKSLTWMSTQKRYPYKKRKEKNEIKEKEKKKNHILWKREKETVVVRLRIQNMMQTWEISNWIFEPFSPTISWPKPLVDNTTYIQSPPWGFSHIRYICMIQIFTIFLLGEKKSNLEKKGWLERS